MIFRCWRSNNDLFSSSDIDTEPESKSFHCYFIKKIMKAAGKIAELFTLKKIAFILRDKIDEVLLQPHGRIAMSKDEQ